MRAGVGPIAYVISITDKQVYLSIRALSDLTRLLMFC